MNWIAQSPGPMHEGHVTARFVIDEKANEQQREALLTLMKEDHGGPFTIFAAVTETLHEPIFALYDVTINGLGSYINIPGVMELGLTTIKNPLTDDPEELQLVKPTGFTSKIAHLGMSTAHRYSGGFQHDHSGNYAEFTPIEYSGP